MLGTEESGDIPYLAQYEQGRVIAYARNTCQAEGLRINLCPVVYLLSHLFYPFFKHREDGEIVVQGHAEDLWQRKCTQELKPGLAEEVTEWVLNIKL